MNNSVDLLNINKSLNKISVKDSNLLTESKVSSNTRYDQKVEKFIRALNGVPSFMEIKKEISANELYKIIIPPDILTKITDGTAKLKSDDLGRLLPSVTDSKGKILCQIRLEEIQPEQYCDMSKVAIQSSLSNILNELEAIRENVLDILDGQRTDRLGIIKGAEDTYNQAILAENKENRKALLQMTVSRLNEGRRQLMLSLESKLRLVEDLPDTSLKIYWEALIQKNRTTKNNSLYKEIQEIIEAIVSSTYYLSLSYEELEEYRSLKKSFEPFQTNLLRYAAICNKLSEYIPYRADLPTDRIWYKNPDKALAIMKEKIDEIEFQNKKTLALNIKGHSLLSQGVFINE
ncbi:hypothetical protein [Paenibacillus sp. UNC451MF]|uniref:hypothetical protein n=1 Tax=Paenibacillus sp. UNC451MF TaxID=1449063 RepID=UPI00048CE19B|nr:hypothetical protein [Paenibacillus sp. UNC451MF]